MRFKLTLSTSTGLNIIPVNYSYPLSAAIYGILKRADSKYAAFLHEKGYGKGFKLFSFSQVNGPFKIDGDRLRLLGKQLSFNIAFHFPEAATNFIKGLFQAQHIDIADTTSKTRFIVQSIESLPDPLHDYTEAEIVHLHVEPLSPIVVGARNIKGNYDFLVPEDRRFPESLVYNWREKIRSCYDDKTADPALLLIDIQPKKHPPKSRLVTIKSGTEAETKIRGWMNFEMSLTAEKRFISLLLNAGSGLYNAQGMGYLTVV